VAVGAEGKSSGEQQFQFGIGRGVLLRHVTEFRLQVELQKALTLHLQIPREVSKTWTITVASTVIKKHHCGESKSSKSELVALHVPDKMEHSSPQNHTSSIFVLPASCLGHQVKQHKRKV
jgi:hypothetical protein